MRLRLCDCAGCRWRGTETLSSLRPSSSSTTTTVDAPAPPVTLSPSTGSRSPSRMSQGRVVVWLAVSTPLCRLWVLPGDQNVILFLFLLWGTWSRSEYSHACFTHCQNVLISAFLIDSLAFFRIFSLLFNCIRIKIGHNWTGAGSCVESLQNINQLQNVWDWML